MYSHVSLMVLVKGLRINYCLQDGWVMLMQERFSNFIEISYNPEGIS